MASSISVALRTGAATVRAIVVWPPLRTISGEVRKWRVSGLNITATAGRRRDLPQHFQRFADHRIFEKRKAGKVATGMRHAGDDALRHRIVDHREHDRDGGGGLLQRGGRRGPLESRTSGANAASSAAKARVRAISPPLQRHSIARLPPSCHPARAGPRETPRPAFVPPDRPRWCSSARRAGAFSGLLRVRSKRQSRRSATE